MAMDRNNTAASLAFHYKKMIFSPFFPYNNKKKTKYKRHSKQDEKK